MSEGFKVVERIGGGEFLDMWTGVHLSSNTNVNIQILDKKKLGNAFDTNRFNQLCDFVLTLNHPNVLKYFKVVANDKSIAVVTEPIQGRSLRDYLVEKSNKRLSESEARSILRQIVEGVSYLHGNNIVHRNLTLHNIYISNQGDIKLGNALICAKSTDMGKPVSNQKSDCYFFAPEVWDPHQDFDASCDLWSIGVILYVLVCGCYPFDGKNEISVYLSAKHAKFMIPNFISAECSSLIRQLLMPAKEARMKLEEIKYHPWYNNLSAPLLRQTSSQSFNYSLHSIPESINETEEEVKQEETPSQDPNISLSDFAFNYAFNMNIPLELTQNASAPIVEIPTDNNNSNTNDPTPGPGRRYSYSTPSSPVPVTLEELQAQQQASNYGKTGRKRSADQEQLLAMIRSGGLGIDESNMPTLGTTPPQARKRTPSMGENKEIINMLEMPPLDHNSDVNNLSSAFDSFVSMEDPVSATNSPAKPRRKKSDPSSPKTTKKGAPRRTYRRRSLDDFSHLVGPHTNPDLPTFSQVFPEAPKESSFAFQVHPQSPSSVPYSPTMSRGSTSPVYAHPGLAVPRPMSPASVPISPVMFPPGAIPTDLATLAFLEHQIQHMTPTSELPVQPPKITPMVFYSPEIPQDPTNQFMTMQYPYHIPGHVYQQAPQNSQFDVPSQYFPVPATDSETMSLPHENVPSQKHVSNFVGGVIPETEEEWANNVVNHDSTL